LFLLYFLHGDSKECRLLPSKLSTLARPVVSDQGLAWSQQSRLRRSNNQSVSIDATPNPVRGCFFSMMRSSDKKNSLTLRSRMRCLRSRTEQRLECGGNFFDPATVTFRGKNSKQTKVTAVMRRWRVSSSSVISNVDKRMHACSAPIYG